MSNFKKIRLEKGVKQKEVASYLGISQGNLSDWESGRTQPSLEILKILSNYYGVTVDELIGHEDKPILEVKQDNDVAELIQAYKKLSQRQRKQIRLNVYTLLGDKERIEQEIREEF